MKTFTFKNMLFNENNFRYKTLPSFYFTPFLEFTSPAPSLGFLHSFNFGECLFPIDKWGSLHYGFTVIKLSNLIVKKKTTLLDKEYLIPYFE